MDKNKNRTDLLAAGRKKLQQYRQKKDGKGSKSSGKANKSARDVVIDEAPSVAESDEGKKQLPAAEVPLQDSATDPVDSSSFQDSTDYADVGSPEFSTPVEVSEADEDGSKLRVANESIDAETDNIRGKSESGHVPATPLGLKGILDVGFARKAGELNAASGEDQVPDVGAMQERDSDPDNRSNTIEFAGEMNPVPQVNSGDGEEDTKMESTSSAAEQASEQPDGIPAVASVEDNSGDTNTDVFSDSRPFLPIPDPSSDPDPDPTVLPKEDVVAGSNGNEGITLPDGVLSGGEVTPAGLTQLAKVFQLLGEDEFRFLVAARESVSSGHVKNIEFSERLKEQLYVNNFEKELIHLQLCEEGDVRKEFDRHRRQWVDEKSVLSASLGDVEGKNTILSEELVKCRSELDRVTSDMEKLQMNVSSSMTEMDRSAARIEELQAELDRSQRQLSNVSSELSDSKSLLSDLQAKNENLNESVASLTDEKNKLEHQLSNVSSELVDSKSLLSELQVKNENLNAFVASLTDEKNELEHQLSNVSSELVDSKSLLSELQVKNENLNASVASLTDEKNKLEKEKGDGILETEKLIKELMECKSLLESTQVDNVDAKRNLAHVMEEKTKLEEEKQDYASENDRLLTELAEWKKSMEGLQVVHVKLNEVLTSEREDRSKLEEANEHLLLENKKISSEVFDFKNLVESLRSEIANLSESLDLVTKERTKLGEEMEHLRLQKEESLAELTNSKLSMNDLQMEYEKSMNDLKDGALRIAQLTEENATFEAKIREFDDWKMKSEQRDFQETVLVEHDTQQANEQSNNSLEETFIEHVILDEVLKQYVSTVEAKKDELVALCEDLRKEGISTKAKNSELTEKLSQSESRISELQVQVDKLHEQEDHMASLSSQLEALQRKLDASIGTVSIPRSRETGVVQNMGARVAASVDAAVAVIQDLKRKLKEATRNHNLLSNSYNDMMERIKDVEGANGQVAYVLHKVFDNLQKLVDDAGPSTEKTPDDSPKNRQLDHLEISNYDMFLERLITILRERAQLEALNRKYNLELLGRIKDVEEANKRCLPPEVVVKLLGDIQSMVTLQDVEIKPDEPVSSLQRVIFFLVNRDKSAEKQIGFLREKLKPKEMELINLQNQIDHLCFSIVTYEVESHVFKESLRSATEQLVTLRSEMQHKETEFHQSEQRVSALREKLHIAVTKGKGLIQHRDSLKQSLNAASGELEKCLHELQLKDAELQETETKLKAYSEAGERMEALESELSYIRNSATALRESFLLKDSVLQRIEEILEDLELPEDFHVRDIIDKIDWLAKAVSHNSFSVSGYHQKDSPGAASYPDSGSGAVDGWREDLEPSPGPGDELRANYEELQNKFYGLAEQNEMLEQSLMERNKLVQRCEEVLDKINIPPQLRSLEPDDRIEWLGAALTEANDRADSLQQDIHNLEKARESLVADLEESQRRLVDLEAALQSITVEREQLSASLEVRSHDYSKVSEKAALYEFENEKLQNEVGALQLKLDEKRVDEENIRHVHGEIRRLQDLVKDVIQAPETEELDSSTSDIQRLEGLLRKLADKYTKHSLDEHVVGDATEEHIAETSVLTSGERSVEQPDTRWESNLADLERKLAEAEGDLVRAKDERDRHVETIQSLAREVEALQVKNQELQKLLVQEEQKSVDLANEVETLQLKIPELQKLLVQEEQKSAAVAHEIEALEAKNQELQKFLVQEEQKSADLANEVEALQLKIQELQKLLVQQEQKSADVALEFEALEAKNQELQKLIAQEEQKSAAVAHEIETLEAKNQEFQELLVQEEQKSAALANEIEALEGKNQEFQKLLVQEEQKSAALAHEIEALEGKTQEFQKLLVQEEQKSAALAHEIEVLEGKTQEFQKLLAQEDQKSAAVAREIEALEAKNQEFQELLVQEEQKSAALAHEIETLEGKSQEFQKLLVQEEQKSAAVAHEIEELEGKTQEFQKLLAQEEQKSAALVHEIETLEGKNQEFQKSAGVAHEIEALEVKNQELQKLLAQEEQKSATVREKLNVAVRRGKAIVQQRDSMKQTINDLTSEVERLKAELNIRENSLLEYQQKMKDLITSQEAMEDKDSEIRFLKNHLSEAESELQDKQNTLSVILGSLAEIDLGVELRTNDPVQKLQQIEKEWHDLQAAVSSSEQDSRKSKRAAELLLAELNEVQERNEDLVEELSRTTMEISKLSKERDSAEAAKHESFSRLEQLSALHMEERRDQFSELMRLKSGLDQLRPGFSKIYNLLDDAFPKDLDYLYNLEASIRSSLESSDTSNMGGQTLNSSRSENKVNVHPELFLDSTAEEYHNDNEINDLWRFVGSHMRDLITNISGLEEKLQSHSKRLHEEVVVLSETVAALHREMTSHKHSLGSAKEEIAWFESAGQQKENENLVLRKYVSTLYDTCKSSVSEIEKSKGQSVANDSSDEDLSIEGDISVLEERITSIVNRLLSVVKDFNGVHSESVEVNLKEMKATISSLQKELTEKDIQKDRMCVDLVSQIKQAEAAAASNLQELESSKAQIKQAEATAASNLQELESSKAQINFLKGQLESVNLQQNVLEQRVKELERQESTTVVDLHEKVKSLTNALTAKEQEAEVLLQALDEEEAQMENLTNKVTDLERLVKQKDLDVESAEAARGKALKKLSITVSKFDELHHLSETLLSEVDKLQSQLQERDSEISFLRDEITRCTSDSLLALETDKRGVGEIQDILTWLDSVISGAEEETHDLHLDGEKSDQVHEQKEILKKQITDIVSELKDLRQVSQSKEVQLLTERSKVEDLTRRREVLESSLRETETRLSMHENDDDPAQTASRTSEIVEVEPVVNQWPSQGTSQVRSLRKVNNDQLAISIDDMDSDEKDKLIDEDDDKAHGFKSLTTSKLVPRFTRPVTDFVDGLWVSCDRALMRQPVLRLSLILYWAVMHALLAVFVV